MFIISWNKAGAGWMSLGHLVKTLCPKWVFIVSHCWESGLIGIWKYDRLMSSVENIIQTESDVCRSSIRGIAYTAGLEYLLSTLDRMEYGTFLALGI